jgi:pseudouridine-5'-monophosphatase
MSKYTGTPPAVLCDLDGTLLDTETLSTQALNEVIGKWGKVCDWTLKKRLLGLKGGLIQRQQRLLHLMSVIIIFRAPLGLDWTKIVIDDLNLSDVITPAEMVAGWEEALGRLYPQAAVLAGASRLCAHLKRHSIPSAIVTSSNR